jgi:hypothetical protein
MIKIRTDQTSGAPQYVLCVNNEGVPASFEKRKLYEPVEAGGRGGEGMLRVIDESGEAHLYFGRVGNTHRSECRNSIRASGGVSRDRSCKCRICPERIAIV